MESGIGKIGEGCNWAFGNLTHTTKHKRLFYVEAFKSLTANRKLLKANPPLTSVTGDRHGVQCVKYRLSILTNKPSVYHKTKRLEIIQEDGTLCGRGPHPN
uniref:SFRICE_038722 n=1 Tax=Spodoptera frugiperda TaxID=7108 RepID=A0A2H1W837_SPOFR